MTNNTNKHTLPIWTEVEYTALCKNPYLSTPFFIPKESKVFLCKEETAHHASGKHQQKNRIRQRKLPDPLHLYQEHRG